MISIVFSIIILILIVTLDRRKLLDKKHKKERWTSITLFLLGVTLSIIHTTNTKIPSPYQILKFIYKPISDLFFEWLS